MQQSKHCAKHDVPEVNFTSSRIFERISFGDRLIGGEHVVGGRDGDGDGDGDFGGDGDAIIADW